MTLKEKCDFHWRMLGITNVESLKKSITAIFDRCDYQQEVLIELYKLLFPGWSAIAEIKGYPDAGCDLWHFICRLFQEFDRKHHPDCMPGGLWMNVGFSMDSNLEPWGVCFKNCHLQYREPEH
jgi:hypothetical protein